MDAFDWPIEKPVGIVVEPGLAISSPLCPRFTTLSRTSFDASKHADTTDLAKHSLHHMFSESESLVPYIT